MENRELKTMYGLVARDTILFLCAFLALMGLVRHETILRCFDHCSFKLALALIAIAFTFLWQSRRGDLIFWNRARAQLGGAICLAWSGYLVLFGLRMAPWTLEILFVAVALILWLARTNPALRAAAIGIPIELALRRLGGEFAIIIGSSLTVIAGFWSLRIKTGPAISVPSRGRSVAVSIVRVSGLLTVVLIIIFHVLGPIVFLLDPAKRMQRLTSLAPSGALLGPAALSPLAMRLKNHVTTLANDIGERAAYQPGAQAKACAYIAGRFENYGYKPKQIPYRSNRLYYVKDGSTFFNVEAVVNAGNHAEGGVLLVSAHYDSAPGTRGADDNASGVAVLLELARLVKEKTIQREIRFVAFGTEEPPAFGTQNMGSYRYARKLRDEGIQVKGLINLEMLGYFNPKKGSQLYPPFLHLFFPDDGNFIAVVANISSRDFLADVKRTWTPIPDLPLVTALLPTVFSGVTLSDQLNFWNEGFHAVMVSDTAFFRNPNYHESSDTPEKLNYEKMAELTRSLADVIARMSGPEN